MGNCSAKKRAAAAAQLERQSKLDPTGLTGSASSISNDIAGASADLYGAPSGYGDGGYVYASYCPEGIPEDIALLATAAALAAGIYVVYRQITIQTMGRRKKRSGKSVQSGNGTPADWMSGRNFEEPDGALLSFIDGSPRWAIFLTGRCLSYCTDVFLLFIFPPYLCCTVWLCWCCCCCCCHGCGCNAMLDANPLTCCHALK